MIIRCNNQLGDQANHEQVSDSVWQRLWKNHSRRSCWSTTRIWRQPPWLLMRYQQSIRLTGCMPCALLGPYARAIRLQRPHIVLCMSFKEESSHTTTGQPRVQHA